MAYSEIFFKARAYAKIGAIIGLLLAWALAAPLLLQQDDSEELSGSFLVSPFCKQYGCVFVERLNARRTYQVGKAMVRAETLGGGNVVWLELHLPHPQKPLSPATLKLLSDFTRSVLGTLPNFDLGRRCLEAAKNPGGASLIPQRILQFQFKGRTMQMGCLWDDGVYPTAGNFPPKVQLSIGVLL